MSKSHHKNPYRGNYGKLFAEIQKKQVVTREYMLGFANGIGLSENASNASVTVILSPRAEGSCKGDCRGNMSAQGHLYYMERLAKKQAGDKLRFRLRWRPVVLEPHKRETAKVEQKKTDKTAKVEQKKTDKTAKVEATEKVGAETATA